VTASPPSYGFRVEEAWIPMADGRRLAANLYRPDRGPADERFPVLLEYLPYRKDDGTIGRDYPVHGYFARRGYIGARVDLRGTGRSEGRLPDREYSEQEHADGLEVIAWLARQPWSTGKIGMLGISWGGFNAIQMAMLHPPALKAILAIEATDDLFQDDIHFVDGLMHVDEYEISMDQFTAVTQAPDFPVDEASLGDRFDVPPWKLQALRHQRDGPFWKRASLIADYSRLRIPAFLIGGWLDGYRDSVPRMLEHVRAPVKALVGPWNHSFPDDAVPGPTMEWRHEAVRWWDHWLKGRDTGIMEEPRLAVYVRSWHPPGLDLTEVPGSWRFEDGWPLRRSRNQTLYPRGDHSLGRTPGPRVAHDLRCRPSAGAEAGFWWGDLVPDQAPLDRSSLVYDSEPLPEDREILGFPRMLLRASASAPLAHWFVRLSDVAPRGSVTLVTGAGLNGAHRISPAQPRPLKPDRVYPLEIEMHFTSWVFPQGHRIRVAISNALWPMIWPTPYPLTTTLHVGGPEASRLVLPTIPWARRRRPKFRPPAPSEKAPGVRSRGEVWPGKWTRHRDESRGSARLVWHGENSAEFPWGRRRHSERILYAIEDQHPERAKVEGIVETLVTLPSTRLLWRGRFSLQSDETDFHYRFTREVRRNGRVLRRRTWRERIPRDGQ
jgi:putative CocE/NonD family hydrolase